MKQTTKNFENLLQVMKTLRAPGGCPWDRKQTHESLIKYLREESKEVEQAIRKGDMENLEEELGDLLLQILFHSEIANEKKKFSIHDVIETLRLKLTLRHPHVFDKKVGGKKWTADDVVNNWDELKKREKEIRMKLRKKKRA